MFENFRDMCIKIYKVDPAYFLSAPGLTWQACLKKTCLDMLLMVEEGIRGGVSQAVY